MIVPRDFNSMFERLAHRWEASEKAAARQAAKDAVKLSDWRSS